MRAGLLPKRQLGELSTKRLWLVVASQRNLPASQSISRFSEIGCVEIW
jgi:hypothetical protein